MLSALRVKYVENYTLVDLGTDKMVVVDLGVTKLESISVRPAAATEGHFLHFSKVTHSLNAPNLRFHLIVLVKC